MSTVTHELPFQPRSWKFFGARLVNEPLVLVIVYLVTFLLEPKLYWIQAGVSQTSEIHIELPESMEPGTEITVKATKADGSVVEFGCKSRIDTAVEIEYFKNGGILQTVIRKKLNESKINA